LQIPNNWLEIAIKYSSQKPTDDFTFLVGSRHYPCSSFCAKFLSPRVSESQLVDETLKAFSIQAEDSKKAFKDVFAIGHGEMVLISEEYLSTILSICEELWNAELYNASLGDLERWTTIETVFERIDFLSRMRGGLHRERGFIASHFHEIPDPATVLKLLTSSMISEIFLDPVLRVLSDNALFELIAGNSEYCELQNDLLIGTRTVRDDRE
jgi:hypothetical protein